MAGVKVTGIEELRSKMAEMSKVAASEAMDAAYKAAGQVYAGTIRAAAPVGTDPKNKSKKRPPHGELKGSVRIFKGKNNALMAGGTTTKLGRLLIGPSKEHGFYGFWLNKGKWRASTGPRVTVAGKPTRRIKRAATERRHSQSGTTSFREVHSIHQNWFTGAIAYVESAAMEKAEQAFAAIMNRIP